MRIKSGLNTDHLTRVQPGLQGVKVGYECIVDRDQVTWRPVGVFGATKKLQLC